MKSLKDLPERFVVAIDGPAGSGKSTIAKLLAEKIDGIHIDTGAMYRSVTAKALDSGINLSDPDAVGKLAESTNIHFERSGSGQKTFIDGVDSTARIREPDVNDHVSTVAAYPEVRRIMVELQREMGRHGRVVMEGRDIGSNVFPDADFKFYLNANSVIRAERRLLDMGALGHEVSKEEALASINERDMKDSSRESSPLMKADDAVEIDTSHLNIDDTLQKMIKRLVSKL